MLPKAMRAIKIIIAAAFSIASIFALFVFALAIVDCVKGILALSGMIFVGIVSCAIVAITIMVWRWITRRQEPPNPADSLQPENDNGDTPSEPTDTNSRQRQYKHESIERNFHIMIDCLRALSSSTDVEVILRSYDECVKRYLIFKKLDGEAIADSGAVLDDEDMARLDYVCEHKDEVIMDGIKMAFEAEFEKTRSRKSFDERQDMIKTFLEKVTNIDGLSREHISYAVDAAKYCIDALFEIDASARKKEEENMNIEIHNLLSQAIEAVIHEGRATVSTLQYDLRTTYEKAERLINEMEKRNIITPDDGTGIRQIVNKHNY